MPGGNPVISYSLDAPTREGSIASGTAAHELTHQYLFTTSTYGGFVSTLLDLQFRVPLQGGPSISHEISKYLKVLLDAGYITQEGCATFCEMVTTGHLAGREGLRRRYAALWPPYRISVQYFEVFLHAMQKRDLSDSLTMTVASAIAQVMLNVDIFSRLGAYGQISDKALSEFLADSSNHPDSRLQLIAAAVHDNSDCLLPLIDAARSVATACALPPKTPLLGENWSRTAEAEYRISASVNNWFRDLDVFPVVQCAPEQLTEARLALARSALEWYHLDASAVHASGEVRVSGPQIDASFEDAVADRFKLDHISELNDLVPWLQNERQAHNMFVATLYSLPTSPAKLRIRPVDRFLIEVAGLVCDAVESTPRIEFKQRAIAAFVRPDEMKTAWARLEMTEMVVVIDDDTWLSEPLVRDSLKDSRCWVAVFARGANGNSIGEFISFMGGESGVVGIKSGAPIDYVTYVRGRGAWKKVIFLCFLTELVAVPAFRELEQLGARVEIRNSLDPGIATDRIVSVAFWECTYGSMGNIGARTLEEALDSIERGSFGPGLGGALDLEI